VIIYLNKIYFFNSKEECIMAKAKMTEGSRQVFNYLKAAGAGVKFTTK
jgi:hypothetical protein